MSSLILLDEIQDFPYSGDDDELTHLWCQVCNPDGSKALCGVSLEDSEEIFDEEGILLCVVCMDFDKSHPCPRGF